jgi:surface antigen
LGGAYRVDQNPEVGAVAITTAFPSGHAMYVEYVLDDGWVGVSQMNWDVRGHYSTMEVKASGVWFIHFN